MVDIITQGVLADKRFKIQGGIIGAEKENSTNNHLVF
jgi:hypothetical protein